MTEERDRLKYRVYFAAKDGMSISLYTLLSEIDKIEADQLINENIADEDGQECNPLLIAARYGQEKVVRMLLTKFASNIEQEGVVKFDGYVIEGATALWCAACAGHLNIVKTLVKAGADVNHPTKTNSTPLRAACFDGRLDIVKYLTYHKADINIANKYNNTCLMIAAYKGHLDIVNFLLQNGANPNEKALCGATALHFSSECGHVEVVKELLNHGAKFYSNDTGMTPIKCAAERTRHKLVDYLIGRSEINKEEQVEALELLGASYANDKENYNIIKAYKYLHKSMTLRYSDADNPIKKRLTPPIPAYENRIECQTISELEALQGNNNSLHMEALTIRERILGVNNPELPHPIIYRGAVFADNAGFDRCLELWLHALKLRQKNHISVVKDLLRFAQVFSQMLHVGVQVTYNQVIEVLSAAIIELERNKEKLSKPDQKDEPETVMDEIESNLTTTLYLLTILTRLMKKCNEEEKFNVQRMVFALNQLQLTLRNGQTLLHLACNAETPVDDFHTNDICKFPCAETTRLLIRCGANVNAMDNERNTPLHVIVNYHKAISDFLTLHSIITDLTEHGAHTDIVNNKGETPLESSTTGSVAEIILKTQIKISLKCLAANAIKIYNISYTGHVPSGLEEFIELHGKGIERSTKNDPLRRNASIRNSHYRKSDARLVAKRGRVKIYFRKIPQKSLRYVRDLWNTLVNMQWRWLTLVVTTVNVLAYFGCALLFYYDSWISGDFDDDPDRMVCIQGAQNFQNFFMLGIETVTTTGYGYLHPTEHCTLYFVVLAFSTLTSILIDGAFISVVYAKLNRTKDKSMYGQIFSKRAVIALRNGKLCLIVKVNDREGKHWINSEVRLYLIREVTTQEEVVIPNFVTELDTKPFGMLFWPVDIVHEIGPNSPLWDVSARDLMTTKLEILVTVSGSSVKTGQLTRSQTSYLNKEIMWGYQFSSCLEYNPDKSEYLVNKGFFNHTTSQEVPLCSAKVLNKLQDRMKTQRRSFDMSYLSFSNVRVQNGSKPREV